MANKKSENGGLAFAPEMKTGALCYTPRIRSVNSPTRWPDENPQTPSGPRQNYAGHQQMGSVGVFVVHGVLDRNGASLRAGHARETHRPSSRPHTRCAH